MQHREMTRQKWLDSDSAPFVVLLLVLLVLPRGSGRLLFNPHGNWRKVRVSFFGCSLLHVITLIRNPTTFHTLHFLEWSRYYF